MGKVVLSGRSDVRKCEGVGCECVKKCDEAIEPRVLHSRLLFLSPLWGFGMRCRFAMLFGADSSRSFGTTVVGVVVPVVV